MSEIIKPSYIPSVAVTFTPKDGGEPVTIHRPYEAIEIEELRRHAMGGDPGSQFELGERYLYGWGGAEVDYEQAYAYFKQAAENGVQDALCYLADFYLAGEERGIVPRDEKEHLRLRELAAKSGSWQAMEKLARCYEQGVFGAEVDHEKAFYWALEAERMIVTYWNYYNQPNFVDFKNTYKLLLRAHTRITFLLSHFCADGVGTARDLNGAMNWLRIGERFVMAATGMKNVPMFRQQMRTIEQRMKKDEQRNNQDKK